MNDNQKERLLKLAEDNPELAKDVIEIFKEESNKSEAPVAVKIVKDEDDKLEITEEQKKYAIGYVAAPVIAFIILVTKGLFFETTRSSVRTSILIILITIGISWFCAYKAGMPTIKQFFSKHFKFIK